MSRIVCWRGAVSRGPPVRIERRCSSRSRSAGNGRCFTRAAASSIASGTPSTRRQISAMAASADGSVASRSGRAARARSRKSATDGDPRSSSPAGTSSGATAISRSPRRWSVERLVTRAHMPGHAASNSPRVGAASRRCSNVSSTSSTRRSRTCRTSSSRAGPCARSASTDRIRIGTRSAGSRSAASETNRTPPENREWARALASSASRVFPMPPGPVSVRSWSAGSASVARICSSSRSRPINAVCGTGRWPSGVAST